MRIKRENKSFILPFSVMGHVMGHTILAKVSLVMGPGV
jgi:hypothetical protein